MLSRFVDNKLPAASLSRLDLRPAKIGKARRLCLVSDGRATSTPTAEKTATLLAAAGWTVTWLDLAAPGSPVFDAAGKPFTYARLTGLYRETEWYIPLQSLCAYHWLREQTFDLVLFQHGFGAGFYSCMARRLGIAFHETPLVVYPGEPHAFRLERDLLFPAGYADMERNYLEHETAERADGLLYANEALWEWMAKAGWNLPAKTACLAGENEKSTMGCDEWLSGLGAGAKGRQRGTQKPVFISVCLATYNRPVLLREAINSLVMQTYRDFELIVIDDGSTDAQVDTLRDELAPLFRERGWHWEKRANTGPSPARNYAASHAHGDYLLFMDDDNIAYPDELERFAAAAANGCDILTCILGMHPASEMSFAPLAHLPEHGSAGSAGTRSVGWMPLGGCLELAPYVNRMGETNSLFRREVFEKLGGFQGDRAMVFEDFELLIRAALAGYRIDVVPEVLLLYRRGHDSRSMGVDNFASHIESLKPLAEQMPPFLRSLLLTARQESYARNRRRRDQDG